MTTIIRPEVVEEREKQEHNALQAERRRLAHDYLVSTLNANPNSFDLIEHCANQVEGCLALADMLIAATECKK